MAGTPRVVQARSDARNSRLVVELANGVVLALPPRLLQGLRHATPAALANVELTPLGRGLHWEGLDVDLGLSGLAAPAFGSKTWMSELARHVGERAIAGSQSSTDRRDRQPFPDPDRPSARPDAASRHCWRRSRGPAASARTAVRGTVRSLKARTARRSRVRCGSVGDSASPTVSICATRRSSTSQLISMTAAALSARMAGVRCTRSLTARHSSRFSSTASRTGGSPRPRMTRPSITR
jgi:hypothetical protein